MSRSPAGPQATTIEQITLHSPYDSQNDGGAAQVYGRIGATTAQPCPASRIQVQARQKLCWARKDSGEPRISLPLFRPGRQWKRGTNAKTRRKIAGLGALPTAR